MTLEETAEERARRLLSEESGGVSVRPAGPRLADPTVSGAFSEWQKAAKERGYDIQLRSGDRDEAQQAALYNRATPVPGKSYRMQSNGLPVAAPGASGHNKGRSVDVVVYRGGKRVPQSEVARLGEEHGFRHLGDHDPVHFDHVGRQAAPPTETPQQRAARLLSQEAPASPQQQAAAPPPRRYKLATEAARQGETYGPAVPPKPATLAAAKGELYGPPDPLARKPISAALRRGEPALPPDPRKPQPGARPGEMRMPEPEYFAKTKAKREESSPLAQALTPPVGGALVRPGERPIEAIERTRREQPGKIAKAAEMPLSMLLPNTHRVLVDHPERINNGPELEKAMVADYAILRASGQLGLVAEKLPALQRWGAALAKKPTSAFGRAITNVFNPSKVAGQAVGGAAGQALLDIPENLTPQERAARAAQGAGAAVALHGLIEGVGQVGQARAEAARRQEITPRNAANRGKPTQPVAPTETYGRGSAKDATDPFVYAGPESEFRRHRTPRGQTVFPAQEAAAKAAKLNQQHPNLGYRARPLDPAKPNGQAVIEYRNPLYRADFEPEVASPVEQALPASAEPPAPLSVPKRTRLPQEPLKVGDSVDITREGFEGLGQVVEFRNSGRVLVRQGNRPPIEVNAAELKRTRVRPVSPEEDVRLRQEEEALAPPRGAAPRQEMDVPASQAPLPKPANETPQQRATRLLESEAPAQLPTAPRMETPAQVPAKTMEPPLPEPPPAPKVSSVPPRTALPGEKPKPVEAALAAPEPNPDLHSPKVTALNNRVQAEEVDLGLIAPPGKGVSRGAEESQVAGRAAVESGELDPEALARDIARGERPFSWKEAGALLEGKRRLLQKVNAAKTALDIAPLTGRDTNALRAEYEKASNQLQEFVDNVQKGKTEWSNTGRALQAGTVIDTANFADVAAEARRLKGKPLAPKEEAEFQKLTLQIADQDRRIADLEKRMKAGDAAEVITRRSGGRNQQPGARPRKTADEFKAERSKIVDDLLADLTGPKLNEGVTFVAYAGARAGYAAGKLAISYAEEGLGKLDDIIARVISDLKARGIEVTHEDVVEDLHHLRLADQEGKEPRTRSELSQRLGRLRAEAEKQHRLLDELENGRTPPKARTPAEESPSTVELKTAVEVARRVEDLKTRIADVKAGKRPQRKAGDPPHPSVAQLQDQLKEAMRDQHLALSEERLIREIEEQKAKVAAADFKILEPVKRQRSEYLERLERTLREVKAERRLMGQIEELNRKLEVGDYGQAESVAKREVSEELLNLRARRALLDREVKARIAAQRPQGVGEKVLNTLSIPKTLRSSLDISAAGRQGSFLAYSNPDLAAVAFGKQLQALASPTAAERMQQALLNRPNAALYRRSGLYLGTHGEATPAEEAFAGRLFPQWKRLNPLEASERAYTAFLNRMRADSFDRIMRSAGSTDLDTAKAVAQFVNSATGRGGTGIGKFEMAAPALAHALWSPRFMASRFDLVTFRSATVGATPAARKAILKQYLRTLVGFATFAGLAAGAGKLAGADVSMDTDTRGSDFLKLQFGDTRVTIDGAVTQPIVLASKIWNQKTKWAKSDEIKDQDTVKSLADYGRSKATPWIGTAISAWEGKNYINEPFGPGNPITGAPGKGNNWEGWKDILVDTLAPMSAAELVKELQTEGLTAADALSLLNFLGINVSTYR